MLDFERLTNPFVGKLRVKAVDSESDGDVRRGRGGQLQPGDSCALHLNKPRFLTF